MNFKSHVTIVAEKNASFRGKERRLLNKTHDGHLFLLLYSVDTSLFEYFQNANSIEDTSLRSILLTHDYETFRRNSLNYRGFPSSSGYSSF